MLAVEPAVDRLAALIRIPTVSAQFDRAAFDELLATMATQWPRLHELEMTRIRSHGLLIRWPGRAADRPVVLMAHLDVVPVMAGDWARDPFSGDIEDGAIHGRGTLDDKGCVAAICEAVEGLLADGFVPAQDVWLSFGCDEEVFGGAAADAVETLRERGVRPWFVLDEGGAVATEAFPGITAPLAVIGVTEKGATSLTLTATGAGGHASTPSKNGPVARLARAIARLDDTGMPPRLLPTTAELFRRIAPHAPLPLRPLLTNAARLAPAAARALGHAGPEAAALVRTTFAVTTLSGSPAINVIAASATAGVSARVLPGDTVADVVAHVRKAIKDDTIAVSVVEAGEASPISPVDDAFGLIEQTTAELFPDAVPTPYVMLAATDSRHFTAICERVYRFAPFRMSRAQRAQIHAADEHLMVEDYLDGVRWYRRLIEGI